MALNIPNVGTNLDALMKGMDTGGSLFSRIMQPTLQREGMAQQKKMQEEQLAQRMKEHADNVAIQRMQQARLGQMAPLQQQLMKMQLDKLGMEVDPAKKMAYIQSILQGIQGMPGQVGQGTQPESNPMQMYQGMGMPSQEEMQNPSMQPPSQEQVQQGFGGLSPQQQMALSMAGVKVPRPYETPDQKRFADLQAKIQFEKEKSSNKANEIRQKNVVAIEKDLPTLEKSLKGVHQLIDIAKNNPDMFGHGFMPDRFAKTTKIKDFGTWQNLISDAIAGLEQKLSSKGNIVALKMASQLKPSHAEQQDVALGKLESMRSQLEDAIKHSRQITGKEQAQSSSNMDLSQMSNEELMKIAGGGQ